MFVAALIVFVAGTEIRVRAEDGLLAERFQEAFTDYRSRVSAYIPFIR
jgi:protein-S-isoprenylcysteine O-methyltransferase Ste14